MSELGQMLKQARLDRGISIEDLQESTKIRKRYLECIEEGNFKALPGNFYVRAFIKSYAEAVGLDPNEVLNLYRNVIPQASMDQGTETTIAPKRTISKRSDKWSRYTTGVMLVTFFLLIVGLIYYFAYRNYNGAEERSVSENQMTPITTKTAVDNPTPSASASQPEAKAAQTPEVLQPELKFLRNEGGVDYYEVTHSSKLAVDLTLTGKDCWFQMDELVADDNNVLKRQQLEQGSLLKLGPTKSWNSDKPIFLNIGLPTAVELKVNGLKIPLGELSNPKRVQISMSQAAAAQ